jgi:hypothetical protein
VAGDDTIFIALRDPADRPAVEAILLNKDGTGIGADQAHGDR